ncbi:hypothetical protein ACJVC5_14445 [Peredibacter sp. HCB2-198]|uniref:hypothetical protein n=1 Tax=Peredibacter sp. HCB2-198 TaxID=3383025 RepID=UPI0038B61009
MRWLIGLFLFISLALFGGYIILKGYPYRLYSNWTQGKNWNKYYYIPKYRESYLKPVAIQEITPYVEDYKQLWKPFPLRNALVPLPVRHPLFQTIPLVEYTGKNSAPQMGMIILAPNGRELSRLYTLPTSMYQDHSQGQELFKLPFVRNRILKLAVDSVWKDIFSHEIVVKSKSMDEMIYDLYILYLRSKILPKETIRYGLMKNGSQALIELESKDRDYSVEVIFTQQNGSIYAYALKTERNSVESKKLRSKFLEEITFNPIDQAMGKILYTEFKQLNFARQVDQEGMLYLFSAWSQEVENVELLREMIFYLERGRSNTRQLRALYTYSLKQYGKTFTTRKIFSESDDPNLVLQRKIEIENIEKKQQAEISKQAPPQPVELTPDEKMNLYLKKAREEGPAAKNDMTIH